jgi:antitoxin (DNA-binding transcriptional repressor) of toxin-antitoxin stability system
MITTNVAKLKTHISDYIKSVVGGEEITVCIRNNPVAIITAIPQNETQINSTQLGCGKGTVRINGNLTEPALPESDWDMLK